MLSKAAFQESPGAVHIDPRVLPDMTLDHAGRKGPADLMTGKSLLKPLIHKIIGVPGMGSGAERRYHNRRFYRTWNLGHDVLLFKNIGRQFMLGRTSSASEKSSARAIPVAFFRTHCCRDRIKQGS